jgi:hypothetical protein
MILGNIRSEKSKRLLIAKSLRILSNDFCEFHLCTATKKRIKKYANPPRKGPQIISIWLFVRVCQLEGGRGRLCGSVIVYV